MNHTGVPSVEIHVFYNMEPGKGGWFWAYAVMVDGFATCYLHKDGAYMDLEFLFPHALHVGSADTKDRQWVQLMVEDATRGAEEVVF